MVRPEAGFARLATTSRRTQDGSEERLRPVAARDGLTAAHVPAMFNADRDAGGEVVAADTVAVAVPVVARAGGHRGASRHFG
jgi:hypothetical protein